MSSTLTSKIAFAVQLLGVSSMEKAWRLWCGSLGGRLTADRQVVTLLAGHSFISHLGSGTCSLYTCFGSIYPVVFLKDVSKGGGMSPPASGIRFVYYLGTYWLSPAVS